MLFYAVLEIFVNSKIAIIFFLFSFGNFQVLTLTFRPMVHYEFLVLFNNTNTILYRAPSSPQLRQCDIEKNYSIMKYDHGS